MELDGGIPYEPHFTETVAIASIDFGISAGRLTTALPEAIRSVLRERSLLILGSSLKDPHMQHLVRWSAGTTRVTKTWAAALGWTPTDEHFWSAADIELVNCDFLSFISALRAEVLRSMRPDILAGRLEGKREISLHGCQHSLIRFPLGLLH